MVISAFTHKNVKCIKFFYGNISKQSLKITPFCNYIYIESKTLIQHLIQPHSDKDTHTLPWPFCMYHRQVRDRTELTFTVFFLLYCCLSFNRCHSLCLYCNMMGEFPIILSSQTGPEPRWWMRDEKKVEWEDLKVFWGLTLV